MRAEPTSSPRPTPLAAARCALRLASVGLRLAGSLAEAALVFPLVSPARRLALVQRWARGIMRAFGVQLHVEGALPTSGALLLANHVSWLDILVVMSQVPANFVAKSEVRAWPLIGWLAERAGTVFIERARRRSLLRVKNRLAALLSAGRTVALFPEGTTTAGKDVLPFRSGLLQAAVDGGRPVQPLVLAYYGADGRRSAAAAFVGGMSLWHSILAILRAGRITAYLAVAAPILTIGRGRKALAREAQGKVASVLARHAVFIGAELETSGLTFARFSGLPDSPR